MNKLVKNELKVGLRISEALNFDLSLEHGESQFKNLYLLRGKGKKERWVYGTNHNKIR